jgi:7-cyano-7-deazaguanine synthase
MNRPLAVVLVSGGMDSCLTAAIASQGNRLAFLHASYGQRTEVKERSCFHRLADHFQAERRLEVGLPIFREVGGSSLTDPSLPIREGPPLPGQIPTSYVPFRNAHLLSAATSWGELLDASAIYVGAVWEDSSGYPDCRPEFYAAFEAAIREGTRPTTRLKVVTPVIHLTKKDIVLQGRALGAPFEKTWSCYQNDERACGTCESCILRLRGFAEAGQTDPLPYEIRPTS